MIQGNWFRRETGFAGKLFPQGNWFRRQTRFAVNCTSTVIFILVVKQITFNIKANEMVSFCGFSKKKLYMQTAINSK